MHRLKVFFQKHGKNLAKISSGALIYGVFNWFFNYPLYLAAVGYFGVLKGGLLMTFLSFVQCALTLILFDRMGIDWVGVGYLEEIKKKQPGALNRVEKIIVWAFSKGKIVAFVTFSLFVDPLIVTIYFRHTSFKGVTKRDWKLLFLSVAIANFYWTLRSGLLVNIVLFVWKFAINN